MSTTNRRAVQVRISLNACLSELLRLPKGHQITFVVPPSASDLMDDTFRVVIEGDDLPEVPPGVEPLLAHLVFARKDDGTVEAKVEYGR